MSEAPGDVRNQKWNCLRRILTGGALQHSSHSAQRNPEMSPLSISMNFREALNFASIHQLKSTNFSSVTIHVKCESASRFSRLPLVAGLNKSCLYIFRPYDQWWSREERAFHHLAITWRSRPRVQLNRRQIKFESFPRNIQVKGAPRISGTQLTAGCR